MAKGVVLMSFPSSLDSRLYVRISSAEKRILNALATKRGQSLSDLLRQTATEAAQRVAA